MYTWDWLFLFLHIYTKCKEKFAKTLAAIFTMCRNLNFISVYICYISINNVKVNVYLAFYKNKSIYTLYWLYNINLGGLAVKNIIRQKRIKTKSQENQSIYIYRDKSHIYIYLI